MRLIDADALAVSDMAKIIDNYLSCQCNLTVGLAAEMMPTIEPEVRHGRWLLLPNRTAPSKIFQCSECGNVTVHEHFSQNGYYAYCKDCGAKMDGGDESG